MVNQIKKRSEIDPKFKWRVEDLFATDQLWEEEYTTLDKSFQDKNNVFEKLRGRLSKSADVLLECLQAADKYQAVVGKVYVYSFLRFYEDTTNTYYKGMSDKSMSLRSKAGAALSFIEPEILSIDEAQLRDFMQADNGIKLYTNLLEDLLRRKQHILSEKEESILAKSSVISQAANNIYTMLSNADMKFPDIKDEKGEPAQLTLGNYISYIESADRRVRKEAYDTLYTGFGKLKNTLSQTYASSVAKDNFYADVRGYESALAMALFDDNIGEDVYHNLISTVHDYLPAMHRYIALRKKRLGLDQLHMYDIYTPIVKNCDTTMDFETAKQTFLQAIVPLGEEYCEAIKKGYEAGWIDVYENEGKRNGAFQWGVYGSHPFVLLNYHDKIDDMFTLAHELGHAMHSFYTWKTQPYVYGGYTIFLAEIASTVNEALLMHHLLKTTTDTGMKEYLVNHYLDMFRGTLFRQTMFAEFEMITHRMAKDGEPLTKENLCKVYRELNEKYYGKDVVSDDHIALEWARIPHFYTAFYVYKYATGFSAAIALSKMILDGSQEELDKYLTFLKAGSSDYSLEILKTAGVDMTTPKPVSDALEVFQDLVTQMEQMG